jgi:hypothetical protein
MNKYTPGPWKLNTTGGITWAVDAPPKHVAMMNFYKDGSERSVDEEESLANAQLISAAPDLLEALELVERAYVGDGIEMEVAIDACLLVIEKAKGENQ